MPPVQDDPFLEELIAFLPNLRRFALSMARRPDLADDLVQITAERALGARAQRQPDAPLAPWLFRILRNAFIDMTRRDRVRGVQIDIDEMPEAQVVDGTALNETRLMLRSAQEAIAELPEDQRLVILLTCMEEMTYAEAAGVLGIPIGTVMSRLARARLAIARKLGIE